MKVSLVLPSSDNHGVLDGKTLSPRSMAVRPLSAKQPGPLLRQGPDPPKPQEPVRSRGQNETRA